MAWIFDPVSSDWTHLAQSPAARRFHTATRLPDGRVLIVGAGDRNWVFDPDDDDWDTIEPLPEGPAMAPFGDIRVPHTGHVDG